MLWEHCVEMKLERSSLWCNEKAMQSSLGSPVWLVSVLAFHHHCQLTVESYSMPCCGACRSSQAKSAHDNPYGHLHRWSSFPPSLKQWKLLRLHFPEKVGGHGCLSPAWVAFHHPSAGRECRQLWPVLFAQRFHLECMVLPKLHR